MPLSLAGHTASLLGLALAAALTLTLLNTYQASWVVILTMFGLFYSVERYLRVGRCPRG